MKTQREQIVYLNFDMVSVKNTLRSALAVIFLAPTRKTIFKNSHVLRLFIAVNLEIIFLHILNHTLLETEIYF